MRAAEAETGEAGAVVVGGEAEVEDLTEVAAVATVTGVIEEDLTEAMIEATTETMAGVLLGVEEAEEAEEAEGMLLILLVEAEATTADITITAGGTETTSGPRILAITVKEDLEAAQ